MAAKLNWIVLALILILRKILACPIIESLKNDWHFAGTNVALMKPAIQLPGTFAHNYTAGSAVDGNCNRDLVQGPCTHSVSNMNGDLSWSVNLGPQYYVTGVVIYTRKKENHRLEHFKVYGTDSDGHTEVIYDDDKMNPKQFNHPIIKFLLDGKSDRLKHFKVYGTGSQGNTEVIYDDDKMNPKQFNHSIIKFTLDGRKSFSNITVTIPDYSVYHKESYLSLCEVQIYAAPPLCPSPSMKTVHGTIKIFNNTGMLVSNNYTVGSQLLIECSGNYFLRENSSIICQSNGEYTVTPQCAPGCETPTMVDNGVIQDNRTWIEINQSLQFKCNHGFKRSAPIQCCQNGKYCHTPPYCEEVFCPVPEIPQNGGYTVTINNKSRYGTVIAGRCNVGYKINATSMTRTCQIDGQWSGRVHTCRPVTCSKLNNSHNAYYTYNENTTHYDGTPEVYKTVLVGKCKTGYEQSEKSELHCNERGQWGGNIPNCTIMKCISPSKFSNGYYKSAYLSNVYNYNTQLNVICNRGFILKSRSSIRICQESSSWSGDPPICKPITCPRPNNLDGGYYTPSVNYSSPDGLPYNVTLTVTCYDGYTLDSDLLSLRCNEYGKWSNPLAKCKKESSLVMVVGIVSSVVVVVVCVVVVVVVIIYRKRQYNKEQAKPYEDLRQRNIPNEGEYSQIQETRVDQPSYVNL